MIEDKHRRKTMKIEKDVKLIHVKIHNADVDTINMFKKELEEIKKRIPDVEFLLTNEMIEVTDIKYLIKELYTLYKRNKKIANYKNDKK